MVLPVPGGRPFYTVPFKGAAVDSPETRARMSAAQKRSPRAQAARQRLTLADGGESR